jgi:hypothetical protein
VIAATKFLADPQPVTNKSGQHRRDRRPFPKAHTLFREFPIRQSLPFSCGLNPAVVSLKQNNTNGGEDAWYFDHPPFPHAQFFFTGYQS